MRNRCRVTALVFALLLGAPVLAQNREARPEKRSGNELAALLPGDTVITVATPSLRQLRARAKQLERAIPWLLRRAGERGPRLQRGLGRYLRGEDLPPGVDDRRPVAVAMDLGGGRHVFVPVEDAAAFRSWMGDVPVHVAKGYAVATRRGEYHPPEKATPTAAMRGDIVLSVRPAALLEKYRPMVNTGIAAMKMALSAQPEMEKLLPYLQTEIDLLLDMVSSMERCDMGVFIGGALLSLQFQVHPTEKGLVSDVVAAMKKGDTASAGKLGGLLPPGGLVEMEASISPGVIKPILDAVPWKEIWPRDTEAGKKLWTEFIEMALGHLDGRVAVSYSLSFDREKISLGVYEVVGVTDGEAYRKFFREMPELPAFKEMVQSLRAFLPDFKFEIRPDALQVAGVPVDFFREELRVFPGLPFGGEFGESEVMKLEGYVAVVENTALIAVGPEARQMIERMVYLKKAGGVFENMLTSRRSRAVFARGSLDIGALVRTMLSVVPEEMRGPLGRLEKRTAGLTVDFEKGLRGNSVVASVRVPLMQILRALAPEEKPPASKVKKLQRIKKALRKRSRF